MDPLPSTLPNHNFLFIHSLSRGHSAATATSSSSYGEACFSLRRSEEGEFEFQFSSSLNARRGKYDLRRTAA